jgi:hypothetical protein
LFARASAIAPVECVLPSGRVVRVRRLAVRFGRASPDRLPDGALAATYTSKPLVTFNGAAMFGELAVLRWKGGHFIFVEYKGPGDRPNRNESAWIDAALDAASRSTISSS